MHKVTIDNLALSGIDPKQAAVYLAALTCGGGTVLEISRAGNIERTGIYYHINALLEAKLLYPGVRGKKQIFLPADPDTLDQLFEERHQALSKVLPDLRNLFSKHTSKAPVRYFQGHDEIVSLYTEIEMVMGKMTSSQTVHVFSQTFEAVEAMPEYFPGYLQRRAQMAVTTQILLPASEKPKKPVTSKDEKAWAKYSLHTNNRRYIPKHFATPSVGTVIILEDQVVMIDYRTLFGSITTNANLADTWRMFFAITWSSLEKTGRKN